MLQQILGGVGGQGGGSVLSGIGSNLAASAPLLGLTFGAGLGASLGQGSKLGTVLGGAGGLLVGGLGGVVVQGVLNGISPVATLGAIGGLASTAIFGIGAALAVAAFIIGRNSRRRQEERARAESLGAAEQQLDQLLRDIQAHKISGDDGIQRALSIRSEYVSAVSQLKDKKTRNHALQDVSRLDLRIARIREAAEVAANDARRFQDRIPEFATGGVVPGQRGEPRLVLAHGGEIIASLAHQQNGSFMQAAAEAGIPGVRGSGGGASQPTALHVEVSLGTDTQNQLFVNGGKSDKGYRLLVTQSREMRKNGDASF